MFLLMTLSSVIGVFVGMVGFYLFLLSVKWLDERKFVKKLGGK